MLNNESQKQEIWYFFDKIEFLWDDLQMCSCSVKTVTGSDQNFWTKHKSTQLEWWGVSHLRHLGRVFPGLSCVGCFTSHQWLRTSSSRRPNLKCCGSGRVYELVIHRGITLMHGKREKRGSCLLPEVEWEYFLKFYFLRGWDKHFLATTSNREWP